MEIAEEDDRKTDIQGELMQREMAERQQALQNLALLSKSNEELKLMRFVMLFAFYSDSSLTSP